MLEIAEGAPHDAKDALRRGRGRAERAHVPRELDPRREITRRVGGLGGPPLLELGKFFGGAGDDVAASTCCPRGWGQCPSVHRGALCCADEPLTLGQVPGQLSFEVSDELLSLCAGAAEPRGVQFDAIHMGSGELELHGVARVAGPHHHEEPDEVSTSDWAGPVSSVSRCGLRRVRSWPQVEDE